MPLPFKVPLPLRCKVPLGVRWAFGCGTGAWKALTKPPPPGWVTVGAGGTAEWSIEGFCGYPRAAAAIGAIGACGAGACAAGWPAAASVGEERDQS